MQNNKPERTCIACRTKGDKSLFIKVVMNKSGEVFVERAAKLEGRGAYICKNIDCAKLNAETDRIPNIKGYAETSIINLGSIG